MGILRNIFGQKKRNPSKEEHLLSGDYQAVEMGGRFSMASWERLYANVQAVRYVVNAGLNGAIVECGVWRGGSMMAMAQTLKNLDNTDYQLHLYDTFSGMSAPAEQDGEFASQKYQKLQTGKDQSDWCNAGLAEVKSNLQQVEYPDDKIFYIEGKIEHTVPASLPKEISILRIDMDWYEPTLHSLKHMFPRLISKGVIIIDDYGHWEGCRRAVDEYFEQQGINVLLNRIDYTGRIGIK